MVAGCMRIVTQSLDCLLVTCTCSPAKFKIADISIIVLSLVLSLKGTGETVLASLMYLMHTKFLVKLS